MNNTKLAICVMAMLLCLTGMPKAASGASKDLQIYFIDVEGGQATLIVDPAGESILIDTGWDGFGGRDADRIVAAANAAGVKQIDYVIITHYHADHVGGVPQLADKIRVGAFVDHGPNVENEEGVLKQYAAYEKIAAAAKRLSLKPGDLIPVKGMKVEVLAAAGEHIIKPLDGAGQANPLCATEPKPEIDPTENASSLGVLVTFGKFRFLDLGDLTKKKEIELACPNNLIGTVDLFLLDHHGSASSNAKALVQALHPRVAVSDNGARKGGDAAAWQIAHDSSKLQDFWQVHYAMEAGKEHNTAEAFIANLEEKCNGKYIKASAHEDGTFNLTNSRTGFTKTYSK